MRFGRSASKYPAEPILNVDETDLFYGVLPSKTYVSAENRTTARGTKDMKAKGRISVYMCTNATGTFRMPMVVIGKRKEPRCLRGKGVPCQIFSQTNAWSDVKTFNKWWSLILREVRKWTHGPALLLMDGCSSHHDLVDP